MAGVDSYPIAVAVVNVAELSTHKGGRHSLAGLPGLPCALGSSDRRAGGRRLRGTEICKHRLCVICW